MSTYLVSMENVAATAGSTVEVEADDESSARTAALAGVDPLSTLAIGGTVVTKVEEK